MNAANKNRGEVTGHHGIYEILRTMGKYLRDRGRGEEGGGR